MMEKKTWVRPRAEVEKFVANEYVAACGDKNVVYNFVCNGGTTGKNYAIKDASGHVATISGYYLNGNTSAYGYGRAYHPCGATHEAPTNSGFLTGYHLDDPNTYGDENIDVVIWTNNNSNVHCTTNLDMTQWTTNKS